MTLKFFIKYNPCVHYWIISFFLGVCCLALCSSLPSLWWFLAIMPLFFIRYYLPHNVIKKVFTQIFAFILGFFWAVGYTHFVTSWNLERQLEGKSITITGYIASPPHKKPHGVGFEFRTETIAGEKITTKLKLGWYSESLPKIAAGDKWQLLVRLKRPHGVLNPGGFDLEKYLLIHRIRATGYIVSSDLNKLLTSSPYS